MTDRTMEEGFVASCAQCGAPQSVVVGAAIAPCRHCGSTTPLDEQTSRRVQAASAMVSRLAARDQRRLAAQAARVSSIVWMVPAFAIPCWLLFGGIALHAVSGERGKGVSWSQFLQVERTGEGLDGAVAAWWMAFLLLIGLALTVVVYGFLVAYARGLVKPGRALAPLADHGAPRCRNCGAALTAGGVHRVCPACATTNLVDNRHMKASIAELLQQLDLLDQRSREATAIVGRWATRLAVATSLFPALMLFALPVTLFAGRTRPDLLFVPGALLALALLAVIWIAVQRVPTTRTMQRLAPGDVVRVQGVPHRVLGKLDINSMQVATECGVLFLLAPSDTPEPTLALYGYELDDATRIYSFRVQPGGTPIHEDDCATARLSVIDLITGAGTSKLVSPLKEQPIRLFAERLPVPRTIPRWTLVATDIAPDDVLVVPAAARAAGPRSAAAG